MKTEICAKGESCKHFLIERLVEELGGLGNNDFKIKSLNEFREKNRKNKKLLKLWKEFETELIEYFDAQGYYPCFDPMQICWGRRKYLACLKILTEKRSTLDSLRKSEQEVKT